MSIGHIGYVMKNNVKVSEFPCTITTLVDGSHRTTYDAYDFVGTKGLARRNHFLRKKKYPITKFFRYHPDWVTLTDKGGISYWDQTTQAQMPAYALRNAKIYKEVADDQQKANDVLYYCLEADTLIDQLMAPPPTPGLWDMLVPSLLIGGIILTAVMNVYAASQYAQAWGIIKGTSGLLGSLQNYFQHMAGLPVSTIIFPPWILGGITRIFKKGE